MEVAKSAGKALNLDIDSDWDPTDFPPDFNF